MDPSGTAPSLAAPGGAEERTVDLDGCYNFRDLGGYRGAGDRRVRWQVLYRSDGLQRLGPAGLDALRRLGLRSVVDLRTTGELEERGRVADEPGRSYHHLPMFDLLPPAEELPSWDRPDFVAAEYLRMLSAGAPTIAAVLELLAEADSYPLVYHCFAGKDRTGIMSAIVLELLGVADDDIVADYALSQVGLARMLAELRERHPDRSAELDASAAAMVSAEPASMRAFLAGFRAGHGGAEAFAARLGLPGIAGRLRELLLEEINR